MDISKITIKNHKTVINPTKEFVSEVLAKHIKNIETEKSLVNDLFMNQIDRLPAERMLNSQESLLRTARDMFSKIMNMNI